MRQHFKAYIEEIYAKERILVDPEVYACGAWLMEHSWFGNRFVNAVFDLINEAPAKIGWIGSLSNMFGVTNEIFDFCYEDTEIESFHSEKDIRFFLKDGVVIGEGYLINYTKQEYIDLKRYVTICYFNYGGDMFINPLPLLTSTGNEPSSDTDYKVKALHYNKSGDWFMDILEFNLKEYPSDYKDITKDVIFEPFILLGEEAEDVKVSKVPNNYGLVIDI